MIYEYLCKEPECGCRFEVIRKLTDRDKPVKCPDCASDNCKREISTFGKHISWSQWRALD